MIRFQTKIPTVSAAYKDVEAAVEKFTAQEPDTDWVTFGQLIMTSGTFTGIVISLDAAKGISDALKQALAVVPKAPPTPHMTAKAGGFTYAQMIDAGWTDDLLLEHGYMYDKDDIPF